MSSNNNKSTNSQTINEWIEILEPKTNCQMFANLITGECVWNEPKNASKIIRNGEMTQWWELFDDKSQRFYYYCAKEEKTIWKKPKDLNSIIVPLAKLQTIKQNTNTLNAINDKSTQTDKQLFISRSTQTINNSFINKSINPSIKHYLISEARFASKRQQFYYYDDESDGTDDDFEDEDDNDFDADDEYDEDFVDDEESDDDIEDDDNNSIDECDASYEDFQRRQQLITASKESSTQREHKSSLIPTKSHSLSQISVNNQRKSSLNTLSEKTSQTLQLRPETPLSRHNLSLMTTTTTSTPLRTTSLLTTQSKPMTTSTTTSANTLLSFESFARENVSRHRKGLKKLSIKSMLEWNKNLIRKPMISSISDSLLRRESKLMFKLLQKLMNDRKRDQMNGESDEDLVFHLLNKTCSQPILRDELLVQIARQTTNNPRLESELKGLELMATCFWYFPPSNKLSPHLNAFLLSHSNSYAKSFVLKKFEQQLRRSLQSHVVYVRKPFDIKEVQKVFKCCKIGFEGVFGEDLSQALIRDSNGRELKQIAWPIVSLTEALLKCRCLNGDDNNDREGVFRCVGDLDDVNKLKLKIDTTIINRGQMNDNLSDFSIDLLDIHCIASCLKLYFRELKEPLIPFNLYFEALDSAHSPQKAIQLLDKMPKINKLSLSYLIRFLQVFSAPEHVQYTKMDDANLSMVWAPNILRNPNNSSNCQNTNTNSNTSSQITIFEQTRNEMSFVRTLIQNLDTSFMSGIQ